MAYFVADTYTNWERVGEPFTENGRLYTYVKMLCPKCGGDGIYKWGAVINGVPQHAGVCFTCEGHGHLTKKVRLYTEKEKAQLNRAKTARQNKSAAERDARVNAKKAEWISRNGFNEKGTTFVVLGNTFEVKDDLKDAGYKFSRELNWHGAEAIEAPENCKIVEVKFEDLYEWCGYSANFIGEDFMKELKNSFRADNSTSEYMGSVGERLRNLDCVLERKWYNSQYAFWVYTFKCGENKLSWTTSKDLPNEIGCALTVTGTVKDHRNFSGVQTTCLSRCVVKMQ